MLASALVMLAGTHGLAAPKKVDVNTATEKEFALTLGIDAELAKLIGQYREKEAPIESWDEFLPLIEEAELQKRMKDLTIDGAPPQQE